jgi:hypothetical protein
MLVIETHRGTPTMADRFTSTPSVTPAANNQPTTKSSNCGPVRPGTILSSVRNQDAFDRITAYLRRLGRERFFGNVAVTLRDGEVQVVRTEQTLKLSEIPTTATPTETAAALGITTAVAGGAI